MIGVDKDAILRGWDLGGVCSPSYVLNHTLLAANLDVIDMVRRESGAEVIVALKANAMWSLFPLLRRHSDGATASSVAEARLVFEEYGEKAHTYAPIYTDEGFGEIVGYSSHITFNSLAQYERFGAIAIENGVSCGLRINPEFSTVATELYNPAAAGSRLGIPADQLTELPNGVEGLHFHTLCESRPQDLKLTLEVVQEKFGHLFGGLKWLNMGGGHLVTDKDYDVDELVLIIRDFKSRYPHLRVILEPGSAFTWDTGVLVATIEDVVDNSGTTTAVADISFACHMPDCLEMPYKPVILGARDAIENESGWNIGGCSCLAGDFMGRWEFKDGRQPQVGDRIVFRDMIHYTMVKTTMFNGVTHPSIVEWSPEGGFRVVRRFGYEDYKNRMA